MLVFVDESGDPGMDLHAGSSEVFVAVAVSFGSREDLAQLASATKGVRKLWRLPEDVEFKFTKSSNKVRESYLRAASSVPFSFLSVVAEKRKLAADHFDCAESFYQEMVGLALCAMRPHLTEAHIEIDKGGSRGFGRRLSRHLAQLMRSSEGAGLVKHVKMTDSAASEGIQLADMVAGAVARSCQDGKRGSDLCQNFLKRQELRRVVFP